MEKNVKTLAVVSQDLRIVQAFNPASLALDKIGPNMRAGIACLVGAFLRFTPTVLQELSAEEIQNLNGIARKTVDGFKEVTELSEAPGVTFSQRPQRREARGKINALLYEAVPVLQSMGEQQVFAMLSDVKDAGSVLQRHVAEAKKKREAVANILEKMRSSQEQLETLRENIDEVAKNAQQMTKTAVVNAETKLKEVSDNAETKLKEVSDKYKLILAREGVNRQSAFFKQEAKKHEDTSRNWAWGALAAALALLIYALWGDRWIVYDFPQESDGEWTPELVYMTVRMVITRLLVFAVLGYALFFCARNYMAHRHNAIVNRHRRNALATYRMLARANMDPGNADIILTQAARFIYAPQDSGYVRGGGADGGDVSVFETVRRAADATKKITGDD